MGDDTHGERIAILEIEVRHLKESYTSRAAREWAIIMSALGLVGTILGKFLGLFS